MFNPTCASAQGQLAKPKQLCPLDFRQQVGFQPENNVKRREEAPSLNSLSMLITKYAMLIMVLIVSRSLVITLSNGVNPSGRD